MLADEVLHLFECHYGLLAVKRLSSIDAAIRSLSNLTYFLVVLIDVARGPDIGWQPGESSRQGCLHYKVKYVKMKFSLVSDPVNFRLGPTKAYIDVHEWL